MQSPGCSIVHIWSIKRFVLCVKHIATHLPIEKKIRQVMRYSGPRMLWRNPIMTIRHLLLGWGMLK